MPKKEKTNWDNVNMQGFVLDGYVKANNQGNTAEWFCKCKPLSR